MSLVSAAARIVFKSLVSGQTIAGTNVLNAPIEPAEEVLRAKAPVIAVYSGIIKNKPIGRSALGAANSLSLEIVFQVYLPPSELAGEGWSSLNLQKSGAGLAIDLAQRQVMTALQVQNTVWAKLWQVLVAGYDDFDSKPLLVEVEPGVRLPCREIVLTCRTISDPPAGSPLQGFWLDLDAAMRAAEGMDEVADLIKDCIELPVGLPDWRKIAAALGLSRAAVVAGGLGPIDPTEEGQAAPFTEISTIDPADVTVVSEPGTSFDP